MTLKLRIKKEPHELLYVTISCMVLMSAICDSTGVKNQCINVLIIHRAVFSVLTSQ